MRCLTGFIIFFEVPGWEAVYFEKCFVVTPYILFFFLDLIFLTLYAIIVLDVFDIQQSDVSPHKELLK